MGQTTWFVATQVLVLESATFKDVYYQEVAWETEVGLRSRQSNTRCRYPKQESLHHNTCLLEWHCFIFHYRCVTLKKLYFELFSQTTPFESVQMKWLTKHVSQCLVQSRFSICVTIKYYSLANYVILISTSMLI